MEKLNTERMIAKSFLKLNKLFIGLALVMLVASCSNSGNGQLTGVQGRPDWYQPDPFGMVFIPLGSYNMGVSDQDVPYAHIAQSRTVTVKSFYMDETEITNNEWRQFVNWVRDSIVHVMLGEQGDPQTYGYHYVPDDESPEDPKEFGIQNTYYRINWDEDIDWENPDVREILHDQVNGIFIPENEQFRRMEQIDTRKLNFDYSYIDLRAAARDRDKEVINRTDYIRYDNVNCYPDTLVWIRDFAYSFSDPMSKNYFWHPAYDHYPVVGVDWKQANAFNIWRTGIGQAYQSGNGEAFWNDFRLPTESEWEYAARGGLDLSPFPWGGPYIRNSNGCFLANYKPLRGNYVDDGGDHTLIVAHYAPNDYGLYDMAGNVAEWTSDAFNEGSYNFAHDMNAYVSYNAEDEDDPAMKRKTIRGGSWKDIGYYIRTGTRSYEYQDTAKCYLGLRSVQSYLGRAKGDGPQSSNVYQ